MQPFDRRILLVASLVPLALGACDAADPSAVDARPTQDERDASEAAADAGTSRFIVLGDTGTGDENQRAVADAALARCERDGCDFALMLGDNLYTDGADSVDDPIWQDAFEVPYGGFDIPFYAVLGNHDCGGRLGPLELDGLGNEPERGLVEVAYTERSDRWRMPDTHYTLRQGPVGLIALDTNSILWNDAGGLEQASWWSTALAEVEDAPWIVAAGHHPYLSNGQHGDAGDYALALGVQLPIDELRGDSVKAFFDDNVCGQADVYLAGHDHNRQWLDTPDACGGTALIVGGASGKSTSFGNGDHPTRYQDDAEVGFLYVVADGTTFHGQFFDGAGELDFEYTLRR